MKASMLVLVSDFGAAGGAFLTILTRSAGCAASLHPRRITAAETADKRDLLISLMSPTPHLGVIQGMRSGWGPFYSLVGVIICFGPGF
jgi:hypothetical protein